MTHVETVPHGSFVTGMSPAVIWLTCSFYGGLKLFFFLLQLLKSQSACRTQVLHSGAVSAGRYGHLRIVFAEPAGVFFQPGQLLPPQAAQLIRLLIQLVGPAPPGLEPAGAGALPLRK